MAATFDLVVLGTGTAGALVARRCRAAGWSVAIVDERPFGGTCALRGCDPKKVLVGAADLIDWDSRMEERGVIRASDLRIDWPALMRFKRSFTDPVPPRVEDEFAQAGITVFHGHASFAGPSELRLGEQTVTARHTVIATGARPASLGIPGEEHLRTSDDFLELEQLPKRLVFVGGGYIAFEFAHLAARAGAEATLLEATERPLSGFDPDLVDRLVKASEEAGITIRPSTTVREITRQGEGWAVRTDGPEGARTFDADLVVHAGGRAANVDRLDLEKAGVKYGKKGVEVNQHLQSVSNPAVYAAGDAAATRPQLTPVAALEGEVVAENLIHGNRRVPNYEGLASAVFTIPPLATVGLSEEAARKAGLRFTVRQEEMGSWYSSRRVGQKHSASKVLIEEVDRFFRPRTSSVRGRKKRSTSSRWRSGSGSGRRISGTCPTPIPATARTFPPWCDRAVAHGGDAPAGGQRAGHGGSRERAVG